MKKICLMALALVALFSAAGCKKNAQQTAVRTVVDTFELALVTDLGTIDDKSFNQGSWEGLVQYAREKNITHKYYQPSEQSDDAYLTTIDLAVRGGAKLIVTPGFLFEVPVFIAQDRYPNVTFVLVDGSPNNGDWSGGFPVYKTGKNAVGIHYAEDQAGFLAGYAAVKDGNRSLGFMGGMAVPAVVRFGYGFVQGAEFAAAELGLAAGAITMNYHYTGGFAATPEAQSMAASWYNAGVDVIFGCGGAVGNSVMAAAEQAGKKVIGVDVDQSAESPTVITSAMKGLHASVYSAISDYYAGSFSGGRDIIFSADNNGVGLPMQNSKFNTFNNADYGVIFGRLASGEIPRMENLADDGSPRVVPVRITRVTEFR
ncbi:MAG: BMP family ABC transporter substrate-binding protein [Treponema sp.]|nr:BMP family ABC transporter substrate-binding protein [Treponema sp.]MCL2272211.1 BMP family ABC transporter substrate-binding protein [Treponema sp.]